MEMFEEYPVQRRAMTAAWKTGLVMILGASPGAAQPSTRSVRGVAYEPGTATILYTERFEAELNDGRIVTSRTEYRDPQGIVIGERSLNFSRHPFKPEYRLFDPRDGYEEGARVLDTEGKSARVKVFVRTRRDKPLREKVLVVPEPCVIDGGFNAFIKAHWETLSAGKRLGFNFVAPARRDYFAFEILPDSAPGVEGARSFLIRPENAGLRLLVDPIRVTYDAATRRVSQYRGLSNVNDAEGESFKVRILYPNGGP